MVSWNGDFPERRLDSQRSGRFGSFASRTGALARLAPLTDSSAAKGRVVALGMGGTDPMHAQSPMPFPSPCPGAAAPGSLTAHSMSSPIAGLSSMATRHLLAELAHAYEKRGGPKADIRAMGGVEAAKLVRAGEPTDVVILAQKVMKALEGEGWLAAGSVKDFTRSEVGLAVPAGAQRPDIRSEGAVKQAMIEAKRICYSTGPSGDHLKALCEKWGLADTVLKRALVAPPGVPVVSLLAKGEADLGFQQISELTGQTRGRCRRIASCGDPVGDRLFGRRFHEIEAAGEGRSLRRLSRVPGDGRDETPPRHGSGLSARGEAMDEEPSIDMMNLRSIELPTDWPSVETFGLPACSDALSTPWEALS